jgi:uncharacterized repeat protein (TIGR03803 family)
VTAKHTICVAAALLASCGGVQTGSPLPVQAINELSALPATNHGYKEIYSFKGGADGEYPLSGLIVVRGALYGTTLGSGCVYNCSPGSAGTVFSLSTTGSEKVLYSFAGVPDAIGPTDALLYFNRTLYGTTQLGGSGCGSFGCGTVFGVSMSGKERLLYSFKGGSDGSTPFAALIAAGGELYGTTYLGGGGDCAGGCGTVFAISTSGAERILHAFKGYPHDGALPLGALVSANGMLYGTTWLGGGGSCTHGCGSLFEISPSGEERMLHSFKGAPDGENPGGFLINVHGTLYGTTTAGGTSGNCPQIGCGTFFSVTPSGKETVLYSFPGSRNSAEPNGGLLPFDGLLYGTAEGGDKCAPSGRCDTLFDVTLSGKEHIFYRFNGKTGVADPGSPLVAKDGLIYGTRGANGGAYNYGAVYSIEP